MSAFATGQPLEEAKPNFVFFCLVPLPMAKLAESGEISVSIPAAVAPGLDMVQGEVRFASTETANSVAFEHFHSCSGGDVGQVTTPSFSVMLRGEPELHNLLS